jgi:hypothetical protein
MKIGQQLDQYIKESRLYKAGYPPGAIRGRHSAEQDICAAISQRRKEQTLGKKGGGGEEPRRSGSRGASSTILIASCSHMIAEN